MNFLTPQFSASEVIAIARISHNTLQNWLRRGLLDRLGATRSEKAWTIYTLLDAITITAEAQLSFLGVSPKARAKSSMAEKITARCHALINGLPLDRHLMFTSSHDLGATLIVDCKQLADEVLAALGEKQ